MKSLSYGRATFLLSFFAALVLSFASVASAWTGPSASPPSANTSAPLNVSTGDQTKHGWIGLDSLSIFNHMIISGAVNSPNTVRYLNFGSIWDAAGYGIRDNSGTLEFKNLGGSWTSLQSSIYNYCAGGGCGGTSQWTTTGSNIYYSTGNVGVGTASPNNASIHTVNTVDNNWAGRFEQTNGTRSNGIIVTTQTTNANDAALYVASNGGANPVLVARNNGNVGIGTASPAGKFESDSGGAGVWAGMFNYSAGAPSGPYGLWTYGTSYALYAQGPIVTTGNISIGSATLATNGDLYMPWQGQWLSTALSQKGNTSWDTWYNSAYIGSNGDMYMAWRGQWLSTVLSNLPGRLGGQFWVYYSYNYGNPYAEYNATRCPSGSVAVGGTMSDYASWGPPYFINFLCQWITQ